MKKFLTISALLLSTLAHSQTATHCKGITKTGQPCRSIMVNRETGFCRMHDPAAKHCSFMKKDGTQCKMIVKDGQTLCRFHNF